MKVKKRNGNIEEFSFGKVVEAVSKAFAANKQTITPDIITELKYSINHKELITVEEIQDTVERVLIDMAPYVVTKSYIIYREKHNQSRFIKERIDYMDKYSSSKDNAATSSETDANANVTMKNVANLEGEVYKTTNRIIQRQ
jgi:ribonucleoside-triphosphate reductase